tara:strand:+ start:816 stop:1079 length:264 start_codon:yes stop_codon:yes gene_type:complete
MSISTEELKKKIIYKSSYRGTKEMDTLLSSFVKKVINNLNNEDLLSLDNLLDIDDDNLYKFKCDIKTSIKIPNNKINKLFKEHKIKK